MRVLDRRRRVARLPVHDVPSPAHTGLMNVCWRHSPEGWRLTTIDSVLSHANTPGDVGGHPATMADVDGVEVVVADRERATLRVGDVFVKIDSDQARTDVEVEAMVQAPVPTPQILWRKPPVPAIAALPGTALGRLGEPSTASSAAWAAAGAAARTLHDAPLSPWPGRSVDDFASRLEGAPAVCLYVKCRSASGRNGD